MRSFFPSASQVLLSRVQGEALQQALSLLPDLRRSPFWRLQRSHVLPSPLELLQLQHSCLNHSTLWCLTVLHVAIRQSCHQPALVRPRPCGAFSSESQQCLQHLLALFCQIPQHILHYAYPGISSKDTNQNCLFLVLPMPRNILLFSCSHRKLCSISSHDKHAPFSSLLHARCVWVLLSYSVSSF